MRNAFGRRHGPGFLAKVLGLADKLYGAYTARYQNGRFEFRNRRMGAGMWFGLVFAGGVGLKPGQISRCAWSIYEDRLTLKTIPGRVSRLCNAGVWTSAG
jgi:hypothetical protein